MGDGPDTQTDPKQPADGRTFTQAEVNRLMGAQRQELATKYADYDAIKSELENLRDAQLTEQERQAQELTETRAKLAEAEARMRETQIVTDIRVRAAQMGLVDVDAAVALVDRSAIAAANGSVTGTEEALGKLTAARPWLLGQGPYRAPNLNPGGKPPADTGTLDADERTIARKIFSYLPPAEADAAYAKGKAGRKST